MNLRALSFAAVLGLAVFVPSEGLAAWTQNTTFTHTATTSLKIAEPAGFKVSVMVDGKPHEDTIPMVVNLPHADAYVPVTVTAPDGKAWSGKLEVKAHQQTLATFKYTAEAGPAPAPAAAPVRKFVGKVWNTTDKCGAKDQTEIKFEFLAGGQKVQEHVVAVGQANNAVEMPEASYDVRVYTRPAGGSWSFVKTITPFAVTRDGWVADYGCTPRAPSRRR